MSELDPSVDADAGAVSVDGPEGPSPAPAETPTATPDESKRPPSAPATLSPTQPERTADVYARLPRYARSLLKIPVPVRVELATKKESVQEVVAMAPGSIIKFEKGCDEFLQMIVGGHALAQGEAVKIGDKFGFRISSMLLPREQFKVVRRPGAS